jgi:hypothetical protein
MVFAVQLHANVSGRFTIVEADAGADAKGRGSAKRAITKVAESR